MGEGLEEVANEKHLLLRLSDIVCAQAPTLQKAFILDSDLSDG